LGASGQARVWMELLPTASGHREALPPQKSLLNNKKIAFVWYEMVQSENFRQYFVGKGSENEK